MRSEGLHAIGCAAAIVLLSLAYAGCSSGQHSSSSQGKTYTPGGSSQKGKGKSAAGGAGGENGPLPMPANTVNGKTSAPSDEGLPSAARGQSVMNPGAPASPGGSKPH